MLEQRHARQNDRPALRGTARRRLLRRAAGARLVGQAEAEGGQQQRERGRVVHAREALADAVPRAWRGARRGSGPLCSTAR